MGSDNLILSTIILKQQWKDLYLNWKYNILLGIRKRILFWHQTAWTNHLVTFKVLNELLVKMDFQLNKQVIWYHMYIHSVKIKKICIKFLLKIFNIFHSELNLL